jgi:hypothetical protein
MRTLLSTISILLLLHSDYLLGQVSHQPKVCKTEIDSLTKQLVYVTVDVNPLNEGGDGALRKKIEKNIIADNIRIDTENYDPNVIVAVIVDTDGSIKGCRIVKDRSNKIGQQLLDIIKSFKWTPAKCDNKNVPMIYKIPLILDPEEQ